MNKPNKNKLVEKRVVVTSWEGAVVGTNGVKKINPMVMDGNQSFGSEHALWDTEAEM